MKKVVVGVVLFIMGFLGVLLINYMAIEHPIGVLTNNETNFEAFINDWKLNTLYKISLSFTIIGLALLLVEPIISLHKHLTK